MSTAVTLENETAPDALTTFADVVTGDDRRWFFTVAGYPDYAAGSFWSLLWDTPAFTPIAFIFKPYGNATPSAAQPHFTGQVIVDTKPPVGGPAGQAWTFDTRLTCTARPLRAVA